jgi:hypothetical protein
MPNSLAVLVPSFSMNIRAFLLAVLLLPVIPAAADNAYQSPDEFLDKVFGGPPPAPQILWLKGETRETAREILGHKYPGLRIRYWAKDNRSAWIMEEIGKVKPITAGLVVNNGSLEIIQVLAFRESRGWEIRYPFFTNQFSGVTLTEEYKLDRIIDGISGATLSVTAMKKLARLALYFDKQIRLTDDTSPQE